MADIIDNNGTMVNGTNTLSGSAVSFFTPRITNITSLKVYFSPKQAGTGDPNPENVREITGWDNVIVHRARNNNNEEFIIPCKKELFDIETYPLISGQWISGGDGQATTNENYDRSEFIPLDGLDGCEIILNKRPGGHNPGIAFYSTNNKDGFISGEKNNNVDANTPMIVTIPTGTKYVRFTVPHGATDVQLTLGGASMLFGGCIDVITGEVTQTQKMYIFDGTENWGDGSTYAPGHRFYSYTNNPQTMDMMYGRDRFDTIACNYLTPDANGTSASSSKQNIITIAKAGRQFYVAVTFCDSIDEWKAYLSEHPLKVVANLKNPLSYVISPHQLATLKNSNTFWSNADRIEITYEYINQFNAIESRNLILRNTPHISQATGNVANFGTDMGSELKECKINLFPQQEGTGDPSPTNIRTLNGWADLQVYQFGENAIGTVVEPQQLVENGLLWNKLSDGTVEYSGKVTGLSGIDISYVDVTNMDRIYGKIIGDNGNIAFNTLILYDDNFKQVGRFANGDNGLWETYTRANTIASADISEFTTATKARIRIKRNINNINMRGRFYTIIGSSEKDIKYNQTTITFQPAGKNLFNLHVPEVDMLPRSSSATTKRLFTPNTIVNQTSGTNYFSTTYMPYSVNGNTLTINCKSGYGTGFAFRLKPSTTYTINADFDVDTSAGIGVSYYTTDGTFYKYYEGVTVNDIPLSFTTRADTDIVLLTFKAVDTKYYNTDIHITNIQLEEGSTGTEYEDYQYPIWGGYVDLVNNEWVETWGHIHLTSENIQGIRTVSSDKPNFVYTYAINDAKILSENEYANSMVSDKIKAESISTAYPDEFEGYMNDVRRFCFGIPSELSTIEQVKTWVDSIGGIDLCYRLATPIHHSLVIPNFSTLHGINNIWSNGNGGINLSYYKHGDNSYQYIPANTLATNNDYIIVTSDGYVIGDENDYITY